MELVNHLESVPSNGFSEHLDLYEFGRMLMEMSFCDAICFGIPNRNDGLATARNILIHIAGEAGLEIIPEWVLYVEEDAK